MILLIMILWPEVISGVQKAENPQKQVKIWPGQGALRYGLFYGFHTSWHPWNDLRPQNHDGKDDIFGKSAMYFSGFPKYVGHGSHISEG